MGLGKPQTARVLELAASQPGDVVIEAIVQKRSRSVLPGAKRTWKPYLATLFVDGRLSLRPVDSELASDLISRNSSDDSANPDILPEHCRVYYLPPPPKPHEVVGQYSDESMPSIRLFSKWNTFFRRDLVIQLSFANDPIEAVNIPVPRLKKLYLSFGDAYSFAEFSSALLFRLEHCSERPLYSPIPFLAFKQIEELADPERWKWCKTPKSQSDGYGYGYDQYGYGASYDPSHPWNREKPTAALSGIFLPEAIHEWQEVETYLQWDSYSATFYGWNAVFQNAIEDTGMSVQQRMRRVRAVVGRFAAECEKHVRQLVDPLISSYYANNTGGGDPFGTMGGLGMESGYAPGVQLDAMGGSDIKLTIIRDPVIQGEEPQPSQDDFYDDNGEFDNARYSQRFWEWQQSQQNRVAKDSQIAAEADTKHMKISSHDITAYGAILACLLDPVFVEKWPMRLSIPLICSVDYKGFKVICRALTDDNFACHDGNNHYGFYADGETFMEAPSALALGKEPPSDGSTTLGDSLYLLAMALNVQPVAFGDHTIYLSAETNVHQAADGRFYLHDVHGIFPAAEPNHDNDTDSNARNLEIAMNRLRPELVAQSTTPLPADAFTMKFGSMQRNEIVSKVELGLKSALIPALMQHEIDLDVELVSAFLFDSTIMEDVLHSFGINMRYLGQVAAATSLPAIRYMCTLEAIVRTAKNILNASLRRVTRHGGNSMALSSESNQINPLDPMGMSMGMGYGDMRDASSDLEDTVVDFFKLVCGGPKDADSVEYWKTTLIPAVEEKFDMVVAIDEVNPIALFNALQRAVGVMFSETDLAWFAPRVTTEFSIEGLTSTADIRIEYQKSQDMGYENQGYGGYDQTPSFTPGRVLQSSVPTATLSQSRLVPTIAGDPASLSNYANGTGQTDEVTEMRKTLFPEFIGFICRTQTPADALPELGVVPNLEIKENPLANESDYRRIDSLISTTRTFTDSISSSVASATRDIAAPWIACDIGASPLSELVAFVESYAVLHAEKSAVDGDEEGNDTFGSVVGSATIEPTPIQGFVSPQIRRDSSSKSLTAGNIARSLVQSASTHLHDMAQPLSRSHSGTEYRRAAYLLSKKMEAELLLHGPNALTDINRQGPALLYLLTMTWARVPGAGVWATTMSNALKAIVKPTTLSSVLTTRAQVAAETCALLDEIEENRTLKSASIMNTIPTAPAGGLNVPNSLVLLAEARDISIKHLLDGYPNEEAFVYDNEKGPAEGQLGEYGENGGQDQYWQTQASQGNQKGDEARTPMDTRSANVSTAVAASAGAHTASQLQNAPVKNELEPFEGDEGYYDDNQAYDDYSIVEEDLELPEIVSINGITVSVSSLNAILTSYRSGDLVRLRGLVHKDGSSTVMDLDFVDNPKYKRVLVHNEPVEMISRRDTKYNIRQMKEQARTAASASAARTMLFQKRKDHKPLLKEGICQVLLNDLSRSSTLSKLLLTLDSSHLVQALLEEEASIYSLGHSVTPAAKAFARRALEECQPGMTSKHPLTAKLQLLAGALTLGTRVSGVALAQTNNLQQAPHAIAFLQQARSVATRETFPNGFLITSLYLARALYAVGNHQQCAQVVAQALVRDPLSKRVTLKGSDIRIGLAMIGAQAAQLATPQDDGDASRFRERASEELMHSNDRVKRAIGIMLKKL